MYRGQSGLELKYSKNWILRRKRNDHKTIWFVSQYQDISIDIMSASYTNVIWLSLDNNWFYIYGGSILFLGQLSWEFSQAGKKGAMELKPKIMTGNQTYSIFIVTEFWPPESEFTEFWPPESKIGG